MIKTILFTILFLSFIIHQSQGQPLLDRPVTLHIRQARIADVLTEVSKQGQFYFSYDSRLIPKDSLITLSLTNEKISAVLAAVFPNRYHYEERRNYVIITAQLRRLTLVNTDFTDEHDNYSVSGIIADDLTGERLMYASVYDKEHLISTLTDEHGYFRLRLTNRLSSSIRLTVSKQHYRDTSVIFLQSVLVNSIATTAAESSTTKSNRVEHTALGDLFISARQKIQSLNIPDFFAKRPFQVSLTPGMSSHGMFSSQVVNNFSLNLVGGYTAGVKGLEVGGLFNINKEHSRYLQMAGVFNLVGGNMTGLQMAGVYNLSLDTLRGVQVSLFINRADAQVSGLQMGLLHNSTRHLKGVQIGLVNVADTSDGVSLGLINLIQNGFYQVGVSANQFANFNISFKSGTHNFYTTVLFSANPGSKNPLLAAGLGIGHDFMLSSKFYISAEANFRIPVTQTLEERWDQGKLLLNAQVSKHLSLMAGPTFNKYSYIWSNTAAFTQDHNGNPYYSQVRNTFKTGFGWEAGIAYTGLFKPLIRSEDHSNSWSAGVAITAGLSDLSSYGRFIPGMELALYRDLGSGLSGLLATGYTRFPSATTKNIDLDGNIYYDSGYGFIPVKAGVRYHMTKKFFIEGAVGEAFRSDEYAAISNPSTNGSTIIDYPAAHQFMYSISAGFSFSNGLEAGLKKEAYKINDYQQYALRLGYRFKL